METPKKYNQKRKYPGSIWGLTSFFNSQGHRHKADFYRIFKNNLQRQGLKLLTVECAVQGEPFVLTPEDADILIQVRSDSILWHKERLLNIGLENLPADCDKIVLADSDIIFLDDSWVVETCELLEHYECLKPFYKAIRLSKKATAEILNSRQYYPNDYRYHAKTKDGYLYSFNESLPFRYSPELAWAMRREIFDGIGFYDRMIVGSGDSIMTAAFGQYKSPLHNYSLALQDDIITWYQKLNQKMSGHLSYHHGTIVHLFHGSMKNRNYFHRDKILEKYSFQPYEDIKLNSDKCWEWASSKKELHREVELYFTSRNENQSIITTLITSIKNFQIKLRDEIRPRLFGKIGKAILAFSPGLYRYLKNNYKF